MNDIADHFNATLVLRISEFTKDSDLMRETDVEQFALGPDPQQQQYDPSDDHDRHRLMDRIVSRLKSEGVASTPEGLDWRLKAKGDSS